MATLDYTGDGGAYAPCSILSKAPLVCFYRRLKVADIIAADATMTTNGYILANDIIQALDIPIGFIFNKAILRIITASTNAVNCEVGLAGGAEMLVSMDMDGSAGVMTSTIESDSFAGGKCFYAADTVDVQYISANATDGDSELFVLGHMLVLGTA